MARGATGKNVFGRQRALLPLEGLGKLLPLRHLMLAILLASFLMGNASSLAQTGTAATPDASPSPLSADPRSWAVDATANELIALHHTGMYLRYRMHVVDEKGDKVRDIIESKDGSVARLIMKDGKPLTDEQDKAERQRLNDMLESPSNYARHVKNDASARKIADSLMRLMPDAMIYTYAPGQPQSGRNNGAIEIVLDYKPNPKFSPPTTMAEALTGLEGRVWIDARSRYVVRMDGTIFRGVNFGWGMLAHIYPGGKLTIEQTDAGSGRWIFTRFTEQITARALLLKTLNLKANIEASNFQTIAPMTYQDAVRLLLNTPLPGS